MRTLRADCPDALRMLLHYASSSDEASLMLGVAVGPEPAAVRKQVGACRAKPVRGCSEDLVRGSRRR